MDAKDNEEGDKSGGNVPDPFRDPQADSVSFFDDRDEGLYFGTGDQESVAENQPDDDNLREIALYERREHVARKNIEKEIQDA